MFSVKVCLSAAAARRRTHALSGRAVCAALAMVALCAAAVPARATEAHRAMVVAENTLAANAGVEILGRGGNAIDAAAATALAVGVTNPASCGIGGGGFMLIYLARTHSFYALDYRERAPMAATPRCTCATASPTKIWRVPVRWRSAYRAKSQGSTPRSGASAR